MTVKKKLNGDQPATQADLATWGGELTRRITILNTRIGGLETRMDKLEGRMDKLENRMDKLETRMDSLETSLKAVLEIVQSIDQQLKEWHGIPEKVERLHKRVFLK